MKRRIIVVAFIILCAMFTACSFTDVPPYFSAPQTSKTSAPNETIQKTDPMISSETPTPLPSLMTEKNWGYITNAYTKDGVNYIEIDYVSLFYKDEAFKEAVKDGAASEEEIEQGYLDDGGIYT